MGILVSSSISGIVLCGGLSRRMGRDKAWLPWPACRDCGAGRDWSRQTLLGHAVRTLQPLVEEVIVVARDTQSLPSHSARVVTDRIKEAGPLGGLEAGLAAMDASYAMMVACDMPWLNPALLEAMTRLAPGWDLVIPRLFGRYQPLHAVYAKNLQPLVHVLLAQGERRVHALVEQVKARVVDETFLRAYDPSFRSVRSLDDWISYQSEVNPYE